VIPFVLSTMDVKLMKKNDMIRGGFKVKQENKNIAI